MVVNLTEQQIKKYIENKRPPIEIRNQVDIGYSFENYTLEIHQVRPRFNDKNSYHNIAIAKAKHIKSQGHWKIYWMRSNMKWVGYKPTIEFTSILDVLKEIDEDKHGCFWV